jgi:hypothetical protein
MWRRKATRYAWGTAAENELRNVLTSLFQCKTKQPARICRSAKSGGLFDVWALGRYIWVFQVKRGRLGTKAAHNLLLRIHREVDCPDARIFVANRYNVSNKVHWSFYCLEGTADIPGYVSWNEKAA